VIPHLSDEQHERLWRICDALVSGSGARAAMVCDAASGSVIVSVGDASAAGAVSGVEALGPGERVVRGAGGQIYGVDIPGGVLLAVLHDAPALEGIRAVSAEAVHDVAELLASLPPSPSPEPAHDHSHATATTTATKTATAPRRRATKSKPAPKKPAKRAAKSKRAPGKKPKARPKSKRPKRRR
jgi:hypothetical protein